MTINKTTFLIIILFTSFYSIVHADGLPPRSISFMIGEWQAIEQTNAYTMKVFWNSRSEEMQGTLTKNGHASGNAGFYVGEHIFTAKIIEKPSLVVAIQKYRSGHNGVSNWSGWVTAQIDIKNSTKTRLVATFPTYLDGGNQKSVYRKIN